MPLLIAVEANQRGVLVRLDVGATFRRRSWRPPSFARSTVTCSTSLNPRAPPVVANALGANRPVTVEPSSHHRRTKQPAASSAARCPCYRPPCCSCRRSYPRPTCVDSHDRRTASDSVAVDSHVTQNAAACLHGFRPVVAHARSALVVRCIAASVHGAFEDVGAVVVDE